MTDSPYILHMFTHAPNVSPFDVNMAIDSGYNVVIPYTHLTVDQVQGMTQDAIFSRGPSGVKRTAIFIGGRDNEIANDMVEAAHRAMVPPFEVSVFADPSGAFTTAAAMVACVERALKRDHGTTLEGKRVAVIGGTGPVGAAAAVLSADAGADVHIIGYEPMTHARTTANRLADKYEVEITPAEADLEQIKLRMVRDADVVLATSKAGVQVLTPAGLATTHHLLVAADVNAVPPAGIAGIDLMDDGKRIESASGKTVAIGALAIGNVKYQTMQRMFRSMVKAEKPVYYDFRAAFAFAREFVSETKPAG
ncbi:MAG: methylenetetrahydromethanopterin dehydrogenase [Betaproteobacteria bacterium]|jgi:methylene-tetrahydromethanopterin dehydrogenase|nr:methylenetetrahydromethanopterin dehydrogenase [Betaproteobacteria bacterium]NBT06404.1 methylenetetrahydromethanopterin dehydrogenase [Betaproteobacteria bacterium]NBU12434.1 methylenetetrahydromethanopterin dehydrogenase [Betaproteobacteria bacterium]NBY52880.1 methylenetetrahydromethanopterin dehydrogenase [Betaproteobacteria bacterium]NCU85976.1 methylenetetrahydromethanopterin dehydrogenase [Betaproteobacteria bacterium]